jgi:long-chain acyl-CoA synthetase
VAPAPIEGRLVMHEDVDAGIVLGAGLPQPLAVVVLSESGLERAKHDAGRTQVAASLAAHVAQINDGLDSHERLSCVVVSSQPWTVENGILTPTLKVRRARLEEFFADQLDNWRSAGTPVVWGAA